MKVSTLDHLSAPQQAALIDLVLSRCLSRMRAGYGDRRTHAVCVIAALERKGLCRRRELMGCMGDAVPTETGWRVIKASSLAPKRLGSFPAWLR